MNIPKFKHLDKRNVLIIAGVTVAVIAIIAGIIYWLMNSVDTGATKNIDKNRSDTGNAIKVLNTELGQQELTSKERVEAFDQLNHVLTTLESDLCKDQKSSVVYNITKAKERCDTSRQKLDAVRTAAQNVADSIKDDQALAAIMNPAKANDPMDPAKQLEIWTTVVAKLQPLRVSASSTELKNSLITASTAYKTAWQDLITADKEHNKANYEGTVKRLQAVQGTVMKVTDQQTAELGKLLTQLKAAMTAYQKN